MSNADKLALAVIIVVHIIGVYLIFTSHIYFAALIIGGFYVYAGCHNRVVDWLNKE